MIPCTASAVPGLIPLTRLTACALVLCVFSFAGRCLAQPKPLPDEWYLDDASLPRRLEGKPAPEITAREWMGTPVVLKEQRGKIVIVDFWAAWCGPCIRCLPMDTDLASKYRDHGVVLVGVHDGTQGWERAVSIAKDKRLNYPVGLDMADATSNTASQYKLQFWPTYVVIDRNGIVRASGLKPERVEDTVRMLLDEPATAGSAESEFGSEAYLGGESRPAALRALEGKPMPALQPVQWLGDAAAGATLGGAVTVLHFFSPSVVPSMKALESLAPLHAELAPQGVVFLAVCDGRASWDLMKKQAESRKIAISIMQDRVEKTEGGPARSATAEACGIRFLPATLVIDRRGTVRAAGVRADKIKTIAEKLLSEPAGAAGS